MFSGGTARQETLHSPLSGQLAALHQWQGCYLPRYKSMKHCRDGQTIILGLTKLIKSKNVPSIILCNQLLLNYNYTVICHKIKWLTKQELMLLTSRKVRAGSSLMSSESCVS